MSIRYSCQASREDGGSVESGSGEVEEILEQNTVLRYDLASQHLHSVEVNLSLTTPTAGMYNRLNTIQGRIQLVSRIFCGEYWEWNVCIWVQKP